MKRFVYQTMYMKGGTVVKSTDSTYAKMGEVLNRLNMEEAMIRDVDTFAKKAFEEKKIDHILILVWGVQDNGCFTLLDNVNKQFSYYHLKTLFKGAK